MRPVWMMLLLVLTASLALGQVETKSSATTAPTLGLGNKTPDPTEGALQERLLATLRSNISVKTSQLPFSLVFSQDGRKVAYIARYRTRDLMQEAVVLGETRGPEATFISQMALSPDGSKVAYLASFRDHIEAAYLIIGNRRDQVQIKEGSTGPNWVPVFSPDGKKLAYKVETPSGKHAIRVADISEISPESHGDNRYTPLVSTSGPEFDDVDQAVFSPDGSRMAYTALDHGKWFIVVDGKPGPQLKDAADPVFSPNGQSIAYRASRNGKKYFAVVDDQEGPGFDKVSLIAFSPDGTRVAYGVQEGGKNWIVVGAERRLTQYLADQVVFSSDGNQTAYWCKESRTRGKSFLVINDKPGPEFNEVGSPIFDDSATVAAYWTRNGDRYLMLAGEKRSEPFDGVGRTRRFSADGNTLGFGVLQGTELRWKVMKNR